MTSKRLVTTAHHEAGHAVLFAALTESLPHEVSIVPDDRTLGRAGYRGFVPPHELVQICLAGYAAEELHTLRQPRCLNRDVSTAVFMHLNPVPSEADPFGSSSRLKEQDWSKAVSQVIMMSTLIEHEAIKSTTLRFYHLTKEALTSVWPAVERVAKTLLERKAISGEELQGILAEYNLFLPVFEAQNKHGAWINALLKSKWGLPTES